MANRHQPNESSPEGTLAQAARVNSGDSGTRLAAPRKKLIRRALPDPSQVPRRAFQFAFLLLNVWLGGTFYFWVRRLETGTYDRLRAQPESKVGFRLPG